MKQHFFYDTVSNAISELRGRGFDLDFVIQDDYLHYLDRYTAIIDFRIVDIYRYEGDSDPSDEAVVYALESTNGLKGVLVTGYGISADNLSPEMIKMLE
jgi:hypothetical protein